MGFIGDTYARDHYMASHKDARLSKHIVSIGYLKNPSKNITYK